jgi:hypothetical protein
VAAIGVEDGIDRGTYSAGAFGFGERPEEAVGCKIEEGCDAARIRPTDLYCEHDRFLPFSRMSGAGKILVVALVAFLVYGSVELTAQLDSAVPVNLGYILVGLGAIALPLRNFRRTCWVTAALWLAISGLALAFPLTDAHFHAVAAAFLLVVMTGTTLLSMFHAAPLDEDAAGIASGLAARQLLGAMGSLAIGFASPLADWVWQAQGSAIGRVAFFAAAVLAAGTLVTAIVGGFVESAKRSDDRPVPKIGSPEKPAMLPRKAKATTARRGRSSMGQIGDILVQAVDRLWAMLHNAKEVIRTVSIYVLRTVAYVIWKLVISLVNWVVKVLVLTWRYVAAGVKKTVLLGRRAVVDAVVALVWAAIFVLVPVSALAGTGLLVASSADETRRYIATGALSVLLQIIVVQFLALLLATVAWIMLASQRRRDSLASAQSSATITAPYLLFVAAGGWLLGLPGTFGHGPIRVGFLTLTSTALIVVALVLRPRLNQMQDQPLNRMQDQPEG